MDYLSFRPDFDEKFGKLKLPPDCIVQEPFWEISRPPHFWQVEMFLRFSDETHIRIWEHYGKFGGLQLSRRQQWAYHYGPTTKKDSRGEVLRGEPTDPLFIRIDTCDGLHLHFNARDPHYAQEHVKGVTLEVVDWRSFINSVLKSRRTGKPLDEVFGFTLESNG